MPWTNLDNTSHSRLWEHLNNLWAAVLERVSSYTAAHTPLTGADPPAGTGYKCVVWSGVLTTDASGVATVTLPDSLPNGLMAAIAGGYNNGMNVTFTLDPSSSTIGASPVLKFMCRFAADSSIIPSSPVAITVAAWGW